MRGKTLSSQLLAATDGLVGTITNLVLLNLYIFVSLGGVKTMGDSIRMSHEVHEMLDEVNYDTIKRAIYQLKKQKLINRPVKHDRLVLSITNLGNQRIEELIPTYQTNRPWDGHIYLISYDIPKQSNRSRDILRQYIRKTGGALLQESLWINPYNPTLILEEFTRTREIPGTILVSKLGTDGAIGNETLLDLIKRVYRLDALNDRYADFLDTYEDKHKPQSLFTMATSYLSILKEDPQLPFPLYPKDFLAEKAFHLLRLKFL